MITGFYRSVRDMENMQAGIENKHDVVITINVIQFSLVKLNKYMYINAT